MKKLTSIVGIALLSALIIVPAAVWANGWGMGGGHMMGWGSGPGNYDQDDRGYNSLNGEQQERFADLDRKFYKETRELREKLWTKSAELNELLSSTNPESGKASKLQKEISDLRAKLDEKGINREIEARKIAPDTRVGSGYGNGHMMGGYGYGHMGGAYGMGYGHGGC
ncbi:MAG: periplasmic heavy metal sensor [Pseudomonadota bacterium]|nr:periplasmic heavy metal sensor [Pseudomonadota bacterium]